MKQPIRRRTFGQVLATAAGAISLSGDDDEVAAQEVTGQDALPLIDRIEDVANVADVRQLAKEKLPKATFDYIDTGSMPQLT